MSKPMPKTGVDKLHFGTVTKDIAPSGGDPGAYVVTDIRALPGMVSANLSLEQNSEPFFADNYTYIQDKGTVTINPEFEVADVPPDVLSKYFGGSYVDGLYHPIGEGGDPQTCIMWRIRKANGAYRYLRLYNTKPSMPSMDATTATDSPEYGTSTFTANAAASQYFGQPFGMLDDDDPNLPAGVTPKIIEQMWFADPKWLPGDGVPAMYSLTVEADDPLNGTVTASPNGQVAENAIVTLTATAESGKTFNGWTSDAGGTFADPSSANTTFTMPANDVVITAAFV